MQLETDAFTIEQVFRAAGVKSHTLLPPSIALLYDFFLTFPDEVRLYWNGGFSWIKLFFFCNRYLPLLATFVFLVEGFRGFSGKICSVFLSFHQFIAIFAQVITAVLLIIRTYALYCRSTIILLVLIGLAVVLLALGIWLTTGETRTSVPYSNACLTVLSEKDNFRLMIAWITLAIFDTLVFCLTVGKSYLLRGDEVMPMNRTVAVMIRDGCLYYIVMIAANLANILSFGIGHPLYKGVFTVMANDCSIIMLSRLMLNVRESDIADRTHTTRTLSDDTTLEDPSISFEMTTTVITLGQSLDWSGSTQVAPSVPPLPQPQAV